MRRILGLLITLGGASAALAAPIVPTGYDTDNGGTGLFNYFDDTYNGAGSKTTPYAKLTGGTSGQLNDGIVSSANWSLDPGTPPAYAGPWVGWLVIPHDLAGNSCIDTLGVDPNCHPGLGRSPSVDFHFSGTTAFGTVSLHVDDANGFGDVRVPLGVEILGFVGTSINFFQTYLLSDPTAMTPSWYHLDVGGLMADRVTVRLLYRDNWVFMDEVSFDSDILGGAIVHNPEPASVALTGAGVAFLLWWRRRS